MQDQTEVLRSDDWVVPVGFDLPESEYLVQLLRASHCWQGVQTHAPIADRACFGDGALGEHAADAMRPERGAHKQTLHLARVVSRQWPKRNASGDDTVGTGQQQPTAGRCVLSWQVCQLILEVLESKVDAESRLVLLEQDSGLCDRVDIGRLFYRDHDYSISEVARSEGAGLFENFNVALSLNRETTPQVSWRSPWMDGFVDKLAPFAAPSIAGGAGECPKGRGDGSPRLRSSTGTYCLSNPDPTRSAGDFDSQDANQNAAFGA